MTPLYGFLHGDTIGLVVLARAEDTMAQLIDKLQSAASVRVAPRQGLVVLYRGHMLPAQLTVAHAGMQALDRFDAVPA